MNKKERYIRSQPFDYGNPEAANAILCIHGILGTPLHFSFLKEFANKNMFIRAILLEGHGENVKEFADSSMVLWKKQVHLQLMILLKKYKKVSIAGHSMGCLLALEEYYQKPDKIDSLFLLQPPFYAKFGFRLIPIGIHQICPFIGHNSTWLKQSDLSLSIQLGPSLFIYLGWIKRYQELFKLIKQERTRFLENQPGKDLPIFMFFSSKDEMVSAKSKRLMQENRIANPKLKLVDLKTSGHLYYSKSDMDLVKAETREWLESFVKDK